MELGLLPIIPAPTLYPQEHPARDMIKDPGPSWAPAKATIYFSQNPREMVSQAVEIAPVPCSSRSQRMHSLYEPVLLLCLPQAVHSGQWVQALHSRGAGGHLLNEEASEGGATWGSLGRCFSLLHSSFRRNTILGKKKSFKVPVEIVPA